MGISYNPSIVTDGLVLYLDAANRKSYSGTGTAWNNLSGGGNNGTLTNGPTYSTINQGDFTFDGVDDSVIVPDDASLKLSGDKTLTIWVNMGSSSEGCGFAGKSSTTTPAMALGYGWQSRGFMALAWNSANSPFLDRDANRDIQKWIFLAGVQSQNTRYIYALDFLGLRSSSFDGGTHTWNNNLTFTIGNANQGNNPAPANTKISIVSVYNRALAIREIQQNFDALRGRFGI